jgi:hypothetical protein
MGNAVTALRDDIAAFDKMRAELEVRHDKEWVVFFHGEFVGAFPDFEDAALTAVERFGSGPYLIRQVGAPPVQLTGGMVFRPAHAHDPRRL